MRQYDNGFARAQREYDNKIDDRFFAEDFELEQRRMEHEADDVDFQRDERMLNHDDQPNGSRPE